LDADGKIIADSEKREEMARQLSEVLSKCREVDLTPNEILAIVHGLVLGQNEILIEGLLLERLTDDEAATVLRITYGGLSDDGTFSFVTRRKSWQVYQLCEDAGISRDEVTISPEGKWLRVSIEKLQS
jgi:hypothetical protein